MSGRHLSNRRCRRRLNHRRGLLRLRYWRRCRLCLCSRDGLFRRLCRRCDCRCNFRHRRRASTLLLAAAVPGASWSPPAVWERIGDR